MSPELELTLIVFLCVSIVATLFIGIFLVMWLVNLNKLTASLTETTEIFRMELKPILNELQTSLQKVNGMLVATGNNVSRINKIVMSFLGILGLCLGNFKSISGGFFKGIFQGFKAFSKK